MSETFIDPGLLNKNEYRHSVSQVSLHQKPWAPVSCPFFYTQVTNRDYVPPKLFGATTNLDNSETDTSSCIPDRCCWHCRPGWMSPVPVSGVTIIVTRITGFRLGSHWTVTFTHRVKEHVNVCRNDRPHTPWMSAETTVPHTRKFSVVNVNRSLFIVRASYQPTRRPGLSTLSSLHDVFTNSICTLWLNVSIRETRNVYGCL